MRQAAGGAYTSRVSVSFYLFLVFESLTFPLLPSLGFSLIFRAVVYNGSPWAIAYEEWVGPGFVDS